MPLRPVMVRNDEQVIRVLRGYRQSLGWTQAELDDRIGWASAYTSKVEAPDRNYGRRCVWGITNTLSDWLQGLGLALVIVPRDVAERLCAEDGVEVAPSAPTPYEGRRIADRRIKERALRFQFVFRSAA